MYGDPVPNRQIKIRQYFLQWPFGTQPPNLIPANISGYTVDNNNLHYCVHNLCIIYSIATMSLVH